MFQHDKAADVLGITYEIHPELRLTNNTEVAGIIDRRANKIAVAQKFGFETLRFTGAHEIAHWLLHQDQVMHRDPPLKGISTARAPRPPQEEEADFFAACFLLPAKLVQDAVLARFGTARVVLNDVTAANFGEVDADAFLNMGRIDRAFLVAGARGRGRFESLTKHFQVSSSTMAYRLLELNLVE
jgi:Zn-dependent peptidase ImmA (M78 family)